VIGELTGWIERLDLSPAARQKRVGRLTWVSLVAGPAAGLVAQAAAGGALSTVVTASLAAGTSVAGATLDYVKSRPARITTRRVMQYLGRRREG
jgi:hypothetical protein